MGLRDGRGGRHLQLETAAARDARTDRPRSSFLLIVAEDSLGGLLALLFIAALLTFWAVESTHRLRSWGRWVGAWSEPRRGPRRGDRTSSPAAWALRAVAAAIVAPMIVPAFGSGLLTWRTPSKGGPSDGAPRAALDRAKAAERSTPSSTSRPKLLEQTDAEMFRVRAESPELLATRVAEQLRRRAMVRGRELDTGPTWAISWVGRCPRI